MGRRVPPLQPIEFQAPVVRCVYCGSLAREDKRGNCASCGGPLPVKPAVVTRIPRKSPKPEETVRPIKVG